MYTIENKLVPQRKDADGDAYPWYTPAQAEEYYWNQNKIAHYAREGVTIHHWAKNGAGEHDGIVNYFWNRTDGSTNFVLSDNKITRMVEDQNVAWTSQKGNPTTISIEHQSDLGAEGYRKSGWLIHTLEKKYGRRLTLYPHKHWYNTACPGTLDLARIRAEADKWHNGGGDIMKPEDVDVKYQLGMNRRPTDAEIKLHTGRLGAALDKEILNSEENKALRTKAANFDAVKKALDAEYAEDDEQKLEAIKKIIGS